MSIVLIYSIFLVLLSYNGVFITVSIIGTILKFSGYKPTHFILIQIYLTGITFILFIVCIICTFFAVHNVLRLLYCNGLNNYRLYRNITHSKLICGCFSGCYSVNYFKSLCDFSKSRIIAVKVR